LIARIARLVAERGADPDQVLVLTFTRAAAAELASLVRQRLGEDRQLPRISTLHSFALRQLLRNAARTSLPQPLRIADDFEERWIVAEGISTLIGRTVPQVQRLFRDLSSDWERLTPDWQARFPDPQFLGAWQEHRAVYGYTLRAELVYQLKLAMDEHTLDIEGPPRFGLIDEYQDLNACDLAVIRSLAIMGCEICVAGDDDQSIYGFRFANPDGIRRFPDEYNPCTLLELDLCQRCARNVLAYALHVARQDPRRTEKPLRTMDDAPPGQVHVLRFRNQYRESQGIARTCEWLIAREGVRPDEILVLLRNDRYRSFSDPIRDALRERHLSVSIVSDPLAPLNQPRGREFFSLLRLAHNRDDHLAWRALLRVRSNGLGPETLSRVYDLARRSGRRFANILQAVKADPGQIPRLGSRIATEVRQIEEVLDALGGPSEGQLEAWLRDVAARVIADEALRNEVLDILLRIRQATEAETLETILRAIGVSVGNVEQERQVDTITLMTMHQAKGLSAQAVIVAAAEDEYVPGRAEGEDVEDERRLLYVSLTRARTHLFITFCQRRFGRQTRTGRGAETERSTRTFTRFLRGGPVQPADGDQFVERLE
jgi:DNA helicase-2/ATP-dependent DNA helicase PcrA